MNSLNEPGSTPTPLSHGNGPEPSPTSSTSIRLEVSSDIILSGCLMLNLPPRCTFNALYKFRNGWCASLRADDSWKTPHGSSHYGLSGSSEGQDTPQAAIDMAYEKMVTIISRLDAEPRRAIVGVKSTVREVQIPLDLTGIDIGSLDI